MNRTFVYALVIVSFIIPTVFVGAQEESGKWSEAGQEVKEAAAALKDATADSAHKAGEAIKETSGETVEALKSKSKELLETAKEKSGELVEEAKEKVHEATAPK